MCDLGTLLFAGVSATVLDHAGISPRARALLAAGTWVRCLGCMFAGPPKGWGRRRATRFSPAGRVCPGCRPVKPLHARVRGRALRV